MSLINQVQFLSRRLIADERGWFLKVLDGGEEGLPGEVGEVYLTMAVPGQARGNHYHPDCAEWFTIVEGRALLMVADPVSGERAEWWLDATEPQTVCMPAGLAHVFVNPAKAEAKFLLIAYAALRYDPADTVPFAVTL